MMTPSARDQSVEISGTRVLVVEDEFFIADDLRRALTKAGASVIGPCATVGKTEEAIRAGGFDCAILDLNLSGESGVSLADQLVALNVPFALATGYGSGAVPEHLKGVTRIEKPFDPAAIVEVVARLGTQGARY